MVGLTACFFSSCSDDSTTEENAHVYKTMSIGLDLAKADVLQTKSGALLGDDELDVSSEVPYCDALLAVGDSAVAKYSVVFYDDNDMEVYGESLLEQSWDWLVSDPADGAVTRLSELKQFDYPETAAKAILTITDFRVYYAGTSVLKYITPLEGSAYSAYVTTPVSQQFVIDLYEKQYIKMEVLCFDEQDIPLFGFAWTDFDVVTGQEVCFFFNCLNDSVASLAYQTLPVSVVASFWNGEDYTPYWTGSNYEDLLNTDGKIMTNSFCILCPGNWKGEHAEGEGGFMVSVTTESNTYDIIVTENQINSYLNAEADAEWSDPTAYDWSATIDIANEIPFIHYEFNTCE